MNIAVIGAGLMGRAAVYDLARADGVKRVGVFDIDPALAASVAEKYGNGKAVSASLDAGNVAAAKAALKDYDAALSCVTYRYNPGLTQAAIAANCHFNDLGGNNDAVAEQLAMSDAAKQAGIIVIPDCGLAPGFVSILALDGINSFDRVKSLRIRVGGLPQRPKPPLNYQMVFSAEGLINEYWEPCVVLENGRRKSVDPMTAVEALEFDDIGKLEAFYTSGGTSTLPETYEGKIDFLDYKTIRYPGHCALFRPMLEIGLGSREPVTANGQSVVPRDILKAVLDRELSFGEPDLVLVRIDLEGERGGKSARRRYEIIDREDETTGLTAMMRTTAFPAAIVTWMAAAGEIDSRGVLPQERAVDPAKFIPRLAERGIQLRITN